MKRKPQQANKSVVAKTPSAPQTSGRFSVDTRLFRELGELLVGRESTALAELIKNAYDADATKVTVHADGLTRKDADGYIVVRDDGNGMPPDVLERGFLRIAARTKNHGDRKSPRRGRRFTGEKGVGRLAAHKLAHELRIESLFTEQLSPTERLQPATGRVEAKIDWDAVESADTIDEVPSNAITLATGPAPKGSSTGTTIRLSKLRATWTTRMINEFVRGCLALTPDRALVEPLDQGHFAGKGILTTSGRSKLGVVQDFQIELNGDFQPTEELHSSNPRKAILCIEVKSDARRGLIDIAIVPSKDWVKKHGMEEESLQIKMDDLLRPLAERFGTIPRLSFTARVFERHGASHDGKDEDERGWPSHVRGVRVFMEGFRVLPYGEKTDDWLGLKADVTSRPGGLGLLKGLLGEGGDSALRGDAKEALSLKADHMYMGAVFLTHDGVPDLKMLINREGFLPGAGVEGLARIMGVAIQLATRIRRGATITPERPRGEKPKDQIKATRTAPLDSTPTAGYMLSRVDVMKNALRSVVTVSLDKSSKAAIADAVEALEDVGALADELFTEQAMIRVLASLGTQLSAFSHEVSHLLPIANGIVNAVIEARKAIGDSNSVAPRIVRAMRLPDIKLQAETLLRSLERQAVYLVDVSGTAARRRRSRQNVAERFQRAADLFKGEIDRLGITIESRLDPKWTTEPMFGAELTMIMANLMSNAIKASGKKGRILAYDSPTKDGHSFRLENTGVSVDLSGAERWFKPFRSNSPTTDHTLGQGMGLGLTITRSMLDEYGAPIAFVKPRAGFATAIEIVFPTSR